MSKTKSTARPGRDRTLHGDRPRRYATDPHRLAISAASGAEIHLLDDLAPIRRGPELLDPEAIAQVGDSMIGPIDGSLPRPPSGSWWCVGTADPAATITMVSEAPPG
jgi:hypothetical protein